MALTSTSGTVDGSTVSFSIVGRGAARGDGVIAYLDYTKVGADALKIQTSFNDSKIDTNFYNQIYIESLVLANTLFAINDSGKYRIPLPVAKNEETVKLTISGLPEGTLNIEFSVDQGFI